MKAQMRFEAVFDCGDDDREPRWSVVEWDYISPSGARSGSKVQDFPSCDFGRTQAEELAFVLNREHAFGEYA